MAARPIGYSRTEPLAGVLPLTEPRVARLRSGPSVKKLRVGVIYGGRSGEHEVSIASAAAVFKHLDRSRYEPVAIRIEKDGRWSLPDRPPTALAASEVIEQGAAGVGARGAAGPRGAPGRLPDRGHRPHDRSAPRRRRRGRAGHRPRPRRRLSRAARSVRRGRHGPGPARAGQRALRRGRSAGLGGRDGQGVHEDRLRGPRPADCRLPRRCSRTTGGDTGRRTLRSHRRRWAIRCSSSRPTSGRASASRRRRPARTWRRPSIWRFEFDRKVVVEAAVPAAREIEVGVLGNDDPKRRSPARSCRRPAASSTTTRRSTSTAAPRRTFPPASTSRRRPRCGAWRSKRSRRSTAPGMARVDFLLSREIGPPLRQRGQHHPRLHHHQHVLAAVGRHRRRLPGPARSPDQARASSVTPRNSGSRRARS